MLRSFASVLRDRGNNIDLNITFFLLKSIDKMRSRE